MINRLKPFFPNIIYITSLDELIFPLKKGQIENPYEYNILL